MEDEIWLNLTKCRTKTKKFDLFFRIFKGLKQLSARNSCKYGEYVGWWIRDVEELSVEWTNIDANSISRFESQLWAEHKR